MAKAAGPPGTNRSTTRRGQRARDELMQAAREVLTEQGMEGFSLREVARRTGYAPSAIYNHFPNRDALIAAVAFDSLELLGGYLARVPDDLAADERLVELGLSYIRFAREMRPHWQLIFNRLSTPLESWDTYCELAWPFTEIIATCRAGHESGAIVSGDPAQQALGLWALAHGLASLEAAHLANCIGDIESSYRALLATHVRGLAAPEPSARKGAHQ